MAGRLDYLRHLSNFTLIGASSVIYCDLDNKNIHHIRTDDPANSYILRYANQEEMEKDIVDYYLKEDEYEFDGELTLYAKCDSCGEWCLIKDMTKETFGIKGSTYNVYICKDYFCQGLIEEVKLSP